MAKSAAPATPSSDRAPELVHGFPIPLAERVTSVRYLGGYVIAVTFADGFSHEVDLAGELDGQVFGPLEDKALFSRVRFDPELGTIVWPNGADLAPEFLRYGPDHPDCPCSMHEGERARLAAESPAHNDSSQTGERPVESRPALRSS